MDGRRAGCPGCKTCKFKPRGTPGCWLSIPLNKVLGGSEADAVGVGGWRDTGDDEGETDVSPKLRLGNNNRLPVLFVSTAVSTKINNNKESNLVIMKYTLKNAIKDTQ